MDKPMTRQITAAVVALIGAYLLYLAADNTSNFQTAVTGFWFGVILFVGIAWLLLRYYQPGSDVPTADEVNIREWKVVRFLRYGKEAAPLYLGLRLFLAYEWIEAGLHKIFVTQGDTIMWGQWNPAWLSGGAAIRGYWERAAALTPNAQGVATGPITYPAYRAFIQFMLDNNWQTWYGPLVAWGEVLIGLGFLFGGLVGFAAFFALLMNFAFLYAGSVSSNPTLILLEMVMVFAWRTVGWWGIDRYLLPRIGTPWAPGHPTGEMQPQMAAD